MFNDLEKNLERKREIFGRLNSEIKSQKVVNHNLNNFGMNNKKFQAGNEYFGKSLCKP